MDAFRGLVLAIMVLTPATGDPGHFPLLRHAAWEGATPSDLLFPTFLVTSGISLAFLLRPPTSSAVVRRLVRRTALLIVAGLIYNAYGTTGFDLNELRYTGVLQTIGISGAVAATAVLVTRRSRSADRPLVLAALAIAITAAYWIGFGVLEPCQPDGACNPWFVLDTAALDEGHTYAAGGRGFDPEGVAVTIAASALVLFGYVGGLLVRRAHLVVASFAPRVLVGGALLAASGFLLDAVVPFNKRVLSPSFVLLTSGVALLAFALVASALDAGHVVAPLERLRSAIATPLIALGRNALIVFLLERFLLQTATMVHIGERTAQQWILNELPIGTPGVHIAYTALVLAVILAVAVCLHRRRWYLAL